MIGIILITLSIIILGDNILLMLGNVIVAFIINCRMGDFSENIQ